MCKLISVFFRVNGQNPYWVWFDCQTALKVSDNGAVRSNVGREFPCPVHNPIEWAQQGLIVERTGNVSDIARDAG
jgi:hypothetical protein